MILIININSILNKRVTQKGRNEMQHLIDKSYQKGLILSIVYLKKCQLCKIVDYTVWHVTSRYYYF